MFFCGYHEISLAPFFFLFSATVQLRCFPSAFENVIACSEKGIHKRVLEIWRKEKLQTFRIALRNCSLSSQLRRRGGWHHRRFDFNCELDSCASAHVAVFVYARSSESSEKMQSHRVAANANLPFPMFTIVYNFKRRSDIGYGLPLRI